MTGTDRENRTFEFKTTSFSEDKGEFNGLLSVYDVVDEYGDVVERGAFTKTIQENGGSLPLLWSHNPMYPIGRMELRDSENGLEAKAQLTLDDSVPMAKMAFALVKTGVVRGLSIGYRVVKKKQEDSIRKLKEVKLFEGSLTAIPANRFALVDPASVKSVPDSEKKDFLEELDRIRLQATHYQMLNALEMALREVRWSDRMTNDQAMAAARLVIEQFSTAYLEFFPRYLASRGDIGYASAPIEAQKALEDMAAHILVMANSHSGTKSAAGAGNAEDKTAEPDAVHSALTQFKWRLE